MSSSTSMTLTPNTNEPSTVCVPCAGLDDSALLSVEQIQEELKNMPLWEHQKKQSNKSDCITRKFVAKNFQSALDAINTFGAIAEHHGHHPDLHLVNYRDVEVVLWTHKLGGITKNDIELAKLFETQVRVSYSPKWLKEHPDAS